MELEDIIKELHGESETKVPDVYDKVVNQAKAEGLIELAPRSEEQVNRNNGGAASLALRMRMGIAGLLCLLLIAVFTTVILFATVFNDKIAPPVIDKPPVTNPNDPDNPDVPVNPNPDVPVNPSSIPVSENYAVGVLSTAKLIDAFTETTASRARSGIYSYARSGNSDFFSNYFNAFGTFFGDEVVTVKDNPVSSDKYANKITISGKYANGDRADYYFYYTEALDEDESAADGSTVKYYLDGGISIGTRNFIMIGERTFIKNANVENTLTVRAYPDFNNKNTYAIMQIEYSSDSSQPATKYNYKVVIGGKTVSEAVAYQPVEDASGAAVSYVFEIKGENGEQTGTYSVNKPDKNGLLTVDFEAGGENGQYIVQQTGAKYQHVLAGGFIYKVDGNECTVIGYNKNKTLPENLIIPNAYKGKKVVAIGESAFIYNNDIKYVTIPEGVKTIEISAFNGCKIETVSLPEGLETIGVYAFSNCVNLKNFVLPDSVSVIANSAFLECSSITKVILPEALKKVEGFVFMGCAKLESVSIPKGVTKIEATAFSECTQLTDLTVDKANTVYYSQTNSIIERSTGIVTAGCSSSVIPNDGSITAIGDYAFFYRTGLTGIVIPESVKKIGDSAFTRSALVNINIPEGVTIIERWAFSGCSNLANVTLPSTLETIGGGAFNECVSLLQINIPANVSTINGNVFIGCRTLESITVDAGNVLYHAAGNCLIEMATKKLVSGCYTSIIPADGSVVQIGESAFYQIGNNGKLTIPAGITSICNGAFERSLFTEIELPETLTAIGDGAFRISEIQKIIIPDSVETFGYSVFEMCYYLSEVKLPAGMRVIPQLTFAQCYSLKYIELPETVEVIESYAFKSAELYSIELPETIRYIGESAFSDCRSLRSVRLFTVTLSETGLVGGIVSIEREAFKNCVLLMSVELPKDISKIPAQTFYGCENLTNVIFRGTLEEWNNLDKGEGWNFGCTQDITVQCSDGQVIIKADSN